MHAKKTLPKVTPIPTPTPTPTPASTWKEKETIIKEVVKTICPYCHQLYEESNDKCPNCGRTIFYIRF